jgi:hydrogenase nickel incorporation protein HypA/HybF
VVREALLFSYDVACEGTPLAGSRLVIEEVPVVFFGPACCAEADMLTSLLKLTSALRILCG